MLKTIRESYKEVLRNLLLMTYGGIVFSLPSMMPTLVSNQTTATVVQILGGAAIGQGFINIIYIWFGIDSNRNLINRLDEQSARIQTLENTLTITNTLLQQLLTPSEQDQRTNATEVRAKVDTPNSNLETLDDLPESAASLRT